MFKKRHLVLTAVITAVVVWVLASLLFARTTVYQSADVLLRARNTISQNYVNPLTDEQIERMNDMAISAMVYSLEDQYSTYLNATALDAYQEDKKENYVGIGVSVNFDYDADEMTVISPYDGSPAHQAGILPGDVITKVGTLEVNAETYEAVLDYIKTGEDGIIKMTIRRGDAFLDLDVERKEIKRETVTHKMFAGRIGYIRVSEFIQNTKDDFAAALQDLKGRNMAGLIIDLRNNPGGYADTVLAMTDMLLPEGVIAYLEDSHGKRQYFHSDENALDIPMVVLINQGSASASELLAGSLKAHGLATVIGEKSFGKAVGQSLYPLTTQTALYLTNARYFTPKGECIDGIGIEPDIQVPLAEELIGKISVLEPEEDAQLSRALEVLAQKTEP